MNDKKFLCYFILHINEVMWTKLDAWPIMPAYNVYYCLPTKAVLAWRTYRYLQDVGLLCNII